MQRSDQRILTTHVGSLPRQRELSDLLIAQEAGQSVDEKRLDELADAGVKAQVASQVDIINDGEQPRVGFQTYVSQRLEGFGGISEREPFTDFAHYPDFGQVWANRSMVMSKVFDVPLADIFPIIAQAKVGALSIEFANPRHQHEYAALKKCGMPKDKILMPGVIDSTVNYIEHPQVIYNRILEAVAAVGDKDRVIAGADCGFGTFAGWEMVAASVVWAKFAALAEGARLASQKLW